MGEFQNFKFEDAISNICPETQLNFRKFLQAAGIENMLIKDGRRISDTEVLNEIRKEVAMLSMNDDDERSTSLIPSCMNGDDEAFKLLMMSGEYDVNEVAQDGETALTCAVSANAVRIVEMLLKHGADPNFRGKKVECSPLMEAAAVGYTDIVKLLLEHGACVGQKSHSGNTALHYAATSGHLECVCLLLQYNSPMEVQNDTGHTPLMEATSNGHIDVAQCLIEHGCDINTHSTEFKESALTLASYKGHAEMVRFLLSAGADHEHRTDEMHTALMEAAMEGHVEVVRLLLSHGANVNIPQDSFESPLTLAACGGHTELAHLLIGYGADIEEVNDEGYTPLMEAAREGHEETVALLLAVGADVNARTEETQETALTLAACGGFIEVCEMLLNAGADMEVGGIGCSTPLMEAAQEGHLELVRRLLQRGAAVNAVTATGDTALHYAAESGHVKVCKELLDWGALFGAMTEGARTPLMKAARTGHLEVVQLFLLHGVAIDQSTSVNDANALSLACSGGHAKMVEFLLQHGADPQYQLRDGSTMLIEAARSGNPAVLRLILDYPKCLTKPSTLLPNSTHQLVNSHNNLNQQQSLGHDVQRCSSIYQPLINPAHAVVGNNSIMPPPPPPLPISVSGVDVCFDPNRSHIHHSVTQQPCHLHQQQQLAAYHNPSSGLNVSANPTESQPSQINATALANAYAVGWAAGAAARVQQQQNQHHTSIASVPNSTFDHQSTLSKSNSLEYIHEAQSSSKSVVLTSNSLFSTCTTINAHLNFQTTSVVAAVNSVTGMMTSMHTVLTQATLGATGLSTSTTDSISSMNDGSSTSSESSVSSVLLGSTIDLADDLSAGLLALFQELKPDHKADKDELIRRFEAVMCPFNALRASRVLTSSQQQKLQQQRQLNNICLESAASIALDSSVLDKLVCHQSQCQHSMCHDNMNGNDIVNAENVLPCKCAHASGGDTSRAAHWIKTKTCDHPQPFELQSAVNGSSSLFVSVNNNNNKDAFSSAAISDKNLRSSGDANASINSSPSPLCLAGECSNVGHVMTTNSSKSTTTSLSKFDASLSAFGYQLDKASEALGGSPADPAYLTNLVDNTVGLTPNQSTLVGLNHDMLPCYHHYHHPGSHFACTLDGAAVAGLNHANAHANLHHHHHHHYYHHQQQQLNVSVANDAFVNSPNLLHVPHQNSVLSMDALMASPMAYDPSTALVAHQAAVNGGNRMMPIGTPTVLQSDISHDSNTGVDEAMNNAVNIPSLIDVNAYIESSMETALTLACSGGFVDLVRLLLERGSDKEHRDKKTHTPLHTAVYANQRAVAALLLEYGADIEAQVDRTKDTALSIACSYGKLEIVEELLNRGANKEHRNISDYTPLSLAASGGYVEVIQLLLRHGAEINSRTGSKLGISPLMLASMNGHTAAVRLLLENGSDINAHIETNRNTALTLACFQGRFEVVQLLVERKANIEHRAKTGLTPLMEAASGDYVEVGRILLDHGADVNASPVPSSRDTALTIAADKGNSKFVNLLLDRGAIVESRNKKGATPLWLASNGGHLEVVQSLIQYNADVNSQDNRKVGCLMAAFRKGHMNVVRLLVQYVTQFPSDKDCVRHIKTAVTDKELAKRCQQCREIIIAAKEKQEGEAKKNADCLLEQIEQEEEEKANREAMQARKRERKRMKRKAKQEKERQCKSTDPKSISSTLDQTNESSFDGVELENADESDSEHSPTLSRALEHAQKSTICSPLSAIHETIDISSNTQLSPKCTKSSDLPLTFPTPSLSSSNKEKKCSSTSPESFSQIADSTKLKTVPSSQQSTRLKTSDPVPTSPITSTSITEPNSVSNNSSAASMTEAKREKHRSKKQSQRAAKRASGGTTTFVNSDVTIEADGGVKSPNSDISDSRVAALLSLSPSSYGLSATAVDSNLNWNALIESQSNQLDQYLSLSKNGSTNGTVTTTETNSWTVVPPSNSTRLNRNANTGGRTDGSNNADWKTNNGSNGSYNKRRLSIPVSRHDIGKVIGQGGAVVSALRNMSGIQIDIESARSDEVTERMVYLKGPSEAVQRTFETIQGLLSGSIAGNDVLLTYAAMKKSVTTTVSSSVVSLGTSLLGALTSKTSNGAASSIAMSNANRTTTLSVTKPTMSTRPARRNGGGAKSSVATIGGTNAARTISSQSISSTIVGKTSNRLMSSNNNNAAIAAAATVGSPNISTIVSTTIANLVNNKISLGTNSWSSKVISTNSSSTNNNCCSTKGNFASVAAAGLVSQSSKNNGVEVPTSKPAKVGGGKLITQSTLTPSTGPVSLLSLDLSGYPLNSQMFSDFIPSTNNNVEVIPDSLDVTSFPPLNSSLTNLKVVSSTFVSTATSAASTAEQKVGEGFPCVSFASTTACLINHNTTNPPSSSSLFANVNDFNLAISTQNPTSLLDSYSQPAFSSSVFGPLTVSPPAGTVQLSQPQTPMGSGNSLISTTPTNSVTSGAFTQPKSFARAPGSERSAHQRNANVTLSSKTSAVNESFPSSLMSLDMSNNAQVGDVLLLTPNKPPIVSPEFCQNSLHHFRPDQQPPCDWPVSTSTTAAASAAAASKNSAFSLPNSFVDPARKDPPNVAPPSNWPELKAGAFSTDVPSNPLMHQHQSVLRNEFVVDFLQNSQTNGSNVFRQGQTPNKVVGKMLMPQAPTESNTAPATPNSNHVSSVLNSPLRPRLLPSTSTANMMNGCMTQQHPVSSTTMSLNSAQLSSMMYPLAGQHSLQMQQQQQQIPMNFNGQPNMNLGSRVLNAAAAAANNSNNGVHPPTSHSLMNHPAAVHFPMNCPLPVSGSGESYTPPPYMPGFVQGGAPVLPNANHPNSSGFASHMLNGYGPTSISHIGTSAMPAGISSNAHSIPSLQPIGAERRRQTVTNGPVSSIANSNMYPNLVVPTNHHHPGAVFNNQQQQQHNLHGTLPPTVNSNNPAAAYTPSPAQQCSNANNLFMALTMNWMQQHQHTASSIGTTNPPPPPHPPNWSHSLWPNANGTGNQNNGMPPPQVGSGFAPVKMPGEYNMGLPAPMPNLNGASGPQHQSMVAAAMAAMASIYPWNAAGTNSPMVVTGASTASTTIASSSAAAAATNRWMYSQSTTAGVFPNQTSTVQPLFPEHHHQTPLTALMPNGTVTGTIPQPGSANYSQAL